MKIIDVSHWQNSINWEKVKRSGIECAIMKATQGVLMVDGRLKENRENARKAGVLCGYYHFANGGDPIKEADHFIKTVGNDLMTGELLALDWEINHPNPVAWCKKFLDRVHEKTSIKPLLYTNEARVKGLNWKVVVDGNYGLWVAKYGLNFCIMVGQPAMGAWPFYAIWQYCSRGKVDGITGNVDMNYTTMDLETLKKYGKQIMCNHCCPKHCN